MQRRHPSGTCTCWSWLPRAAAVRPPQDRRLVRVSPCRGPSCVPAVPVRATDALGLSPTDLHAAGDAPLPAPWLSTRAHAMWARYVGALCGSGSLRITLLRSRSCGAAAVLAAIGLSLPFTGDRLVAAAYPHAAAFRPPLPWEPSATVPYSRSQVSARANRADHLPLLSD